MISSLCNVVYVHTFGEREQQQNMMEGGYQILENFLGETLISEDLIKLMHNVQFFHNAYSKKWHSTTQKL